MADTTNSGEFGERADTKAAASKGGKMSSRSSGSRTTSGRGSKEGRIKGGKNSHDNQYTA